MRFLKGGRYACDLQSFDVRLSPRHCRVRLRTTLSWNREKFAWGNMACPVLLMV